jgi:YgiT-type zinc finger domain-containing protein
MDPRLDRTERRTAVRRRHLSVAGERHADARFAQTEPVYRKCPLCGSSRITLATEDITARGPDGREIEVKIRRWACPKCGERFLTRAGSRQLDLALGLEPSK